MHARNKFLRQLYKIGEFSLMAPSSWPAQGSDESPCFNIIVEVFQRLLQNSNNQRKEKHFGTLIKVTCALFRPHW